MLTTFSKKTTPLSGNRRSENNPNKAGSPPNDKLTDALSDTPRISDQPFVMPGTQPVRKTPSIKDLVEKSTVNQPVEDSNSDKLHSSMLQIAQPAEVSAEAVISASDQPAEPLVVSETDPSLTPVTPTVTNTLSDMVTSSAETAPTPLEETSSLDNFKAQWRQLFEELFANFPMIYYPLKEHFPTLENHILKMEVLNKVQKEQCEIHKRAVLEYWRTHFNDDVDDMEIILNEHIEMKKIIFTAEDKIKNLQEQNPELEAFLNILNFKIKD